MAAHLGNTLKAYICSGVDDITNPQDVKWLGCETSNNLNRTQEAIECSDKGSNWAKFLTGKRAGTFEVTVYADNGDPGQVEAINGLHTGEKVHFAIGIISDDAFSDSEFCDCIVTSVSDTNDFGSVSTRTISLQSTNYIGHNPEWEEDEEEDEVENAPAVPEG